MRVLDEIPLGDRVAPEADALRAEIQRVLLEAAGARIPQAQSPASTGAAR